jgi:hypothetical protein
MKTGPHPVINRILVDLQKNINGMYEGEGYVQQKINSMGRI